MNEEERYLHDPKFHALVDHFMRMLKTNVRYLDLITVITAAQFAGDLYIDELKKEVENG